jgi:molybdate transport system regulatory protein
MRYGDHSPMPRSRRLATRYRPVMPLSARNQLDATVSSVRHGSVMSVVTVRLSGGEEIVSAITRDSAEALSLGDGDRVTAIVKATEVILAKD